MVPHLATALARPLRELEKRFLDRLPDIERSSRTQWQEHTIRCCAYGVIARLAQPAAAIEIEPLAGAAAIA